jgi:hypothetical protein
MPSANRYEKSPEQVLPAQGERALATKAFRNFEGCYTKSDRSAMPEGKFYHLENLQPIGAANLHTVPVASGPLWNFGTDIQYYAQFAQVGNTPYSFVFTTNGKVFAYDHNSASATQINAGHLLSGSGSRMAQWENTYVLFIDSTGYYYWNGTTFAQITGSGIPSAGIDIMVYAGRVWIALGRLITISAANDGTPTTDPTTASGWSTIQGADFLNMTDPTLVGSITRLWQQNGYGFIFGTTCVYSISNVYVPAGAVPPTPVFTLLPVQSLIGTDQPASVFPFNNALVFANRYGGWMTDGVNCDRFSEDIDGTWQYLAFSPPISGGVCVVNNIQCSAFLLQRQNDPVFGSNTVIGLWFNGKWWFANFGTVTFIYTAIINAVPTLCAFIGNELYTLFTNTAAFPNCIIMTPQWDMGDPLSDKEIIRGGFLSIVFNESASSSSISATIDGFNSQEYFLPNPSVNAVGGFVFVNNSGSPITFVGSGPINWTSFSTYNLYNGVTPGGFSQAVGMTINTTGITAQITGIYMDYKLGARWQPQ